jgi:L-aminopeptidase/D-esterase-like protein
VVVDDQYGAGRLTDVDGVAVGHWTDSVAQTGCTAIVFPEGTVASCEVRGGAPASRELSLLDPVRTVRSIDAVLLTGGSAFGLAAADGVVSALESLGRGFPTGGGRVPIVPALALYDLGVGDPAVRPGQEAGRSAVAAAHGDHLVGRVGAGAGAMTGNWRGDANARPGGLVAASQRVGSATVAALVAVNAFGSVGERGVDLDVTVELREGGLGTNTTIGVVVTDAPLDKVGCRLLAQAAHDGLARAVFPPHTRFDGDAFIGASTGAGSDPSVGIDALCAVACQVVERAIVGLAVATSRPPT